MAQLNANLQNYETFDDDYGTPIPEGEYEVTILDSEVKVSNNNNPMASFTFEVTGPSHAGRRLWDRFVLNNDIANRRLKTLATVSGHRNPNFIADTEELHGLRCKVRVEIEKQEGYAPKNVIKSYKALNGSKPIASQSATQPVNQTAQHTSASPVSTATASNPTPVTADASKTGKPRYPWEK